MASVARLVESRTYFAPFSEGDFWEERERHHVLTERVTRLIDRTVEKSRKWCRLDDRFAGKIRAINNAGGS